MQIKCLHSNIYKLNSYTLSQQKLEWHRKKYENPFRKWQKLKLEGVSDEACQYATGISRATYFRYKRALGRLTKGILPPTKRPKTFRKPLWGESEKQLVLRLRRENPTYGKAKIAVILKRDHGLTLSESTVGRILKSLKERGLILISPSASRPKRKRRFTKGHAQPWVYGMKADKLGELIQIDHMSVSKNQLAVKHFQAWSPIGKFIYANVYANAKSKTAKRFLEELIKEAPFKIVSIQVDGGSEFMKDFEEACKDLSIQLYVLPPKRPQWNGGVERGNRIFREEFYARKDVLADSIGALRIDLKKALQKYNAYRPHNSLKGLTPLEYINSVLKVAA